MFQEKKSKESCGILLMAVVHDGFRFGLQRLRQKRKREKMDESEKKKKNKYSHSRAWAPRVHCGRA
jgi:hypothetical protein